MPDDERLDPPVYRIEHDDPDAAVGTLGHADEIRVAMDRLARCRRSLQAEDARGIVRLINEAHDPERIVASYNVTIASPRVVATDDQVHEWGGTHVSACEESLTHERVTSSGQSG